MHIFHREPFKPDLSLRRTTCSMGCESIEASQYLVPNSCGLRDDIRDIAHFRKILIHVRLVLVNI